MKLIQQYTTYIDFIFVLIDIFRKYLWAIPLEIIYSQKITQEFSNFLTTSKRSPLKLESERGSEFYKSFFFRTS